MPSIKDSEQHSIHSPHSSRIFYDSNHEHQKSGRPEVITATLSLHVKNNRKWYHRRPPIRADYMYHVTSMQPIHWQHHQALWLFCQGCSFWWKAATRKATWPVPLIDSIKINCTKKKPQKGGRLEMKFSPWFTSWWSFYAVRPTLKDLTISASGVSVEWTQCGHNWPIHSIWLVPCGLTPQHAWQNLSSAYINGPIPPNQVLFSPISGVHCKCHSPQECSSLNVTRVVPKASSALRRALKI